MTSDQALQPQTERALDPNVAQRRAADPESSVWVSASAGSGKTKVLTDRILRLLLPRADGRPGSKAHKILGITFTKAAASEMALRLSSKLGEWTILPHEELEEELKQLLNRKPTSQDIKAARELFADVIDTPGGLKIMTIHAFCQSVLGRFPLEAGLPPYFTVLEESGAKELIGQAQRITLQKARTEATSPLSQAFDHIAALLNEDQFLALLSDMISERRQFNALLKKNFGVDGLHNALCTELGIRPDQTPYSILEEGCTDEAFDIAALRDAASTFAASTSKTDLEKAEKIGNWLNADIKTRTATLPTYRSAFLTQKNQPLKTPATQNAIAANPSLLSTLDIERERLLKLDSQIKSTACALHTRQLLTLGKEILEEYQSLKNRRAALDFDDLILKTSELLTGEDKDFTNAASWVLYKLDQGLDHILVDEAQDTNPDQWSIIEALCTEFFSGQGAREDTRTLFVVGDEKQSIYSFQRASPEEFARMQQDFQIKVEQANEHWSPVEMDISFRSTTSVLRAVDATFADPALRKGLSLKEITHHAYRRGEAGRVELWPIFEPSDTGEIDPWEPPTQIINNPSAQTRTAEYIAEKIEEWIKNGEATPGDIMILMRSRTSLVHALSKVLKAKNIPVSGADRMVLNDQLVIEDLLALAGFALLPDDDLTLACALKSPILGLSEEELFTLAHNRPGSLWQSLKTSSHTDITEYLQTLIMLASNAHPFEFFSHILHAPCPQSDISGLHALKLRLSDEILDPINELLRASLDFEMDNTASLQSFVFWQTHKTEQIKREMEEGGGHVRIMTIHGSKGLQAPIVILPDTLRVMKTPPGQIDKKLIWPDKSDLKTPIFSARKSEDPPAFSEAMDTLDERLDEEYRRLLYVAMTRAEDRLYVTGYKGKKPPLPDSWYFMIKQGLERLEETQEIDGVLELENPQTNDIKGRKRTEKPSSRYDMPDWIYKKPAEEPLPPMPLKPSRPSETESPALSPLKAQDNYRFRRGNITHKLLEFLPSLQADKQEQAAQRFLNRFASDLSENIRQSILDETLALFKSSDFAHVFAPGSQAEVPISGLLPDGRLISGQIDRLLVTDQTVWIIDYKTNRPPPTQAKDIPTIYLNQMQAYADTLKEIYPGRVIKAALLWTDGPNLMPVPLK